MTLNQSVLLNKPLTSSIAVHEGEEISCRQFLSEVDAIAKQLPFKKYVINLCKNPYNFLKAFAAALIQKQVTLFPSNISQQSLAELVKDYESCYIISDETIDDKNIQTVNINEVKSIIDEPIQNIPLIDDKLTASVFFTSGSTGKPKAFEKNWGELAARATLMAKMLEYDKHAHVIIATVPMQHLFGFEFAIMQVLQSKAILHSGRAFFPEDLRAILQEQTRLKVLLSTPYHLQCFTRSGLSFPRLAKIMSSTAPLSKQSAQKIEKLFDSLIFEVYGCTELGVIATRNTSLDENWKAIEGVKFIKDNEDCVVIDDIANKQYILPDLIDLKSEREFNFIGRKEDNINIAGKRMSLSYLTKQLKSIDGVSDAIIYSPSYIDKGLRLIAFVVSNVVREQDIKKEMAKKLDPVFIPKYIYKVSAIPRNEVGKTQKTSLDELVLTLLKPQFEFTVDKRHKSLKGHFPEQPVVPGVVILDYIFSCFREIFPGFSPKNLKQVKFLKPLSAQETVKLHFSKHRQGISFVAMVEQENIAIGVFN